MAHEGSGENVSLNQIRERFMNGNGIDVFATQKDRTAIAVYKAHDDEGNVRPCISLMLQWTSEQGTLSLDEALAAFNIDPDDNLWKVGDPNDGTRA